MVFTNITYSIQLIEIKYLYSCYNSMYAKYLLDNFNDIMFNLLLYINLDIFLLYLTLT
jgi:hypothetical protein